MLQLLYQYHPFSRKSILNQINQKQAITVLNFTWLLHQLIMAFQFIANSNFQRESQLIGYYQYQFLQFGREGDLRYTYACVSSDGNCLTWWLLNDQTTPFCFFLTFLPSKRFYKSLCKFKPTLTQFMLCCSYQIHVGIM